MRKLIPGLLLSAVFVIISNAQPGFDGPLRLNIKNPRYFTDNSGKAIYLTGSHTWENFQDILAPGDTTFDYAGYLDMMQQHGHNFMRMWSWEQSQKAAWSYEGIAFTPLPFLRTGPGLALDGKPKFDLTKFNPEYFSRLKQRIAEAGKRNIYVSVMLFQGWSLDRIDSKAGNPFPYLPFNIANNINKIAAPETTEDYDDKASLHSMMVSPQLLAVQEAYVKKVIETINEFDHVLYEIINEGGSVAWQHHMINFIRKTEAAMPKQHPIGMTHRGDRKMTNEILFNSPVDWISPNHAPYKWTLGDSVCTSSFKENPPQHDGRKVVITDTDHLWGHGGNHQWVWKSFMRGLNPIFMDPWEPLAGKKIKEKAEDWLVSAEGISKDARDYPDWELIRANMGYTRRYALKIDLNEMLPHSELSSTGFCLANIGSEYLIYFPVSGAAKIDFRSHAAEYRAEWFIPLLNRTIVAPKTLKGGNFLWIEPPTALDAVLHLKKI